MKLSQLKLATSKHMMLFGPPKTGKTRLAGQLARKFDLIWFDLERGVGTLAQLPEEWQSRVDVIQIPDTRENPVAIETMLKVLKGAKVSICSTHGRVNCPLCKGKPDAIFTDVCLKDAPLTTVVVIDSLTQLTQSAINWITKEKPDDYKLQYDDWGNLGRIMDMVLNTIQQAPFNVVAISHESEVEMEDGKQRLVPVAGTRNFSRNSPKYFDEVWYADVRAKQHVVGSSTGFAANVLTGSRANLVAEKGGVDICDVFSPPATPPAKSKPVSDLTALRDELKGGTPAA